MTRSKTATGLAPNRATRHNSKTDRLTVETQRTGTMKKGGAGKGNWGKAGDDLDEDLALDENDPGYDSAEELFGKAFGSSPPSGFSWDQVNDISNDDNEAMNEIEAAIKDAWLTQVTKEVAECQDDAEEFFNKS